MCKISGKSTIKKGHTSWGKRENITTPEKWNELRLGKQFRLVMDSLSSLTQLAKCICFGLVFSWHLLARPGLSGTRYLK